MSPMPLNPQLPPIMYAIKSRLLVGIGFAWSIFTAGGLHKSVPPAAESKPVVQTQRSLPKRPPIGFLVPSQILLEKLRH